jgi:hypothetical protein
LRNPIIGIAVCCARAASGYATAAMQVLYARHNVREPRSDSPEAENLFLRHQLSIALRPLARPRWLR